MKRIIAFFAVCLPLFLHAQDTLTMVQYNLLNFGNYTDYCTYNNNNVNDKESCLRTIFTYLQPDIITANELGGLEGYAQRVLTNTLNINGINRYSKAAFVNTNGSDLVSTLFYNNEKLGLLSQAVIPTNYRDILIYNLYYKSAKLATTHDTAFLVCIAAHLKAGDSPSNAQERAVEAQYLMNYLNNHSLKANRTCSGDFNLYGASEQAFQNLINNSNAEICFHDPINEIGEWNSNPSFAPYHTQSTHTSSNSCFASGGLDDRFDFILASQSLMDGSQKMQCLPATYWAIGNDGRHLNDAINGSPSNTSIPSYVLSAIYNMSDHLPVMMKIKVNVNGMGINDPAVALQNVTTSNPVSSSLNITLSLKTPQLLSFRLLALTGQVLLQKQLQAASGKNHFILPMNELPKGLYLLKITDGKGNQSVKKIVKE